MALTKDDVLAALASVRIPAEISAAGSTPSSPNRGQPSGFADPVAAGLFLWSAVCDTFVSVKLNWNQTNSSQIRDQLTRDAEAAIRARATRPADGQPVAIDSLIIEYVDHAGTVLHTHRSTGNSSAPAPAATPKPPMNPPTPPPADGHRPIRLAGSTPATPAGPTGIAGVRHVIAVGAGKGGVGKSSVAINLAVGLARRGLAVGAMDGDIYGPSFPTMFGLDALEQQVHGGMLQPFAVHGVKAITIGKLVDPDKPLIWRGPMAHGAFKQLTEQTNWGELDHLIIDLPPGTGDISLTMAQTLQLTGAVVVCTPQKVAQDDAIRAARMFQQLGIDVLGVVENMSYFVGDDGKEYDIFGRGGAQAMAQRLGVPFLGSIPITMSLRKNSDEGNPTANFTGQSGADLILAKALEELVSNLQSQITLAAMRKGQTRPTLNIS